MAQVQVPITGIEPGTPRVEQYVPSAETILPLGEGQASLNVQIVFGCLRLETIPCVLAQRLHRCVIIANTELCYTGESVFYVGTDGVGQRCFSVSCENGGENPNLLPTLCSLNAAVNILTDSLKL